MLTSDKLSALDNMSVWMVNCDFESCNKEGHKEIWFHKKKSKHPMHHISLNPMSTTTIIFHSAVKIKKDP